MSLFPLSTCYRRSRDMIGPPLSRLSKVFETSPLSLAKLSQVSEPRLVSSITNLLCSSVNTSEAKMTRRNALSSAIYNVYSPKEQWERMWKDRTFEREVRWCEYRELRKHLMEVLGKMENPFVVEAGCGMGAWVAYLSRHGIRNVV